jgi:hypothetical protein
VYSKKKKKKETDTKTNHPSFEPDLDLVAAKEITPPEDDPAIPLP